MSDSDPDKVSRTDCSPWRDAETLRHFYHGKEYSLLETANAIGCTEGTVSIWCGKVGVETRDASDARDAGTPDQLKDESWLRDEYLSEGRTCADLADQLGVTDLTVSRWLRRHDIPTRPAHKPAKERVTITCHNCGDDFDTLPSRADRAKYCSRGCYYDGMDMPTGEDHWSWKETPDHRPAGEEWVELRRQVRERDAYECQVCGVAESDMDRQLDVHHLRRVRDRDDARAQVTADAENLVALCRSCHRRVERYAPLLPPSLA